MVHTKNRSSSSRKAAAGAPPHGLLGLHEALAELLAHGDAGWMVSCYQKLEPADRVGEKTRIKLKNRVRRAADRLEVLGFSHADRETVRGALGRVEEFFKDPSNLKGGRGIAVFAGVRYFRAVPLPYVLRSRVLVDRTPVVSELVALAGARSRVLVVATDRKSARFFDVNLDQVTELDGIRIVCDPKSFLYLDGVKVDFRDELMGRGFVFNNPNATHSCGCGSSFSA